MKTYWELRNEINEGKYVGGPQHTWPQHIGANNSSQANKIKTALTKAGHSFKDHGDLPANKKANKHFISMKDKEGHAALMKLKKTHMKNEDTEDQKEETEVNELKTSTYKSYIKKSEKDDEKAFKTGDYNRSVKRGVGQQMASDALKRKAKKKEEGILDKLKSMTPAAKAAKKAAADKKAMDDMGKSIMSLATAKKG